MGDRGNIVLQYQALDDAPAPRIYLYTHWGGSDLKNTLRRALRRGRERWDDPSYLGRIIFTDMIRHVGLDEVTGYGISPVLEDNDRPLLIVDMPTQQVWEEAERRERGEPLTAPQSFEAFCAEADTTEPEEDAGP